MTMPQLRVRVVNVVDLIALSGPVIIRTACPTPTSESHSPIRSTSCSRSMGYRVPSTSWCNGRPDTDRFHDRGFIEQGTTTTPFDMTVRNRASRFHLVMDA